MPFVPLRSMTPPCYARGDTVKATVDAGYFYGAPVPNAEVSWEITRAEEWYCPEREEWDADLYETYEPEGGQIVRSGTGRTGKDGKLRITFDTDALTLSFAVGYGSALGFTNLTAPASAAPTPRRGGPPGAG